MSTTLGKKSHLMFDFRFSSIPPGAPGKPESVGPTASLDSYKAQVRSLAPNDTKEQQLIATTRVPVRVLE